MNDGGGPASQIRECRTGEDRRPSDRQTGRGLSTKVVHNFAIASDISTDGATYQVAAAPPAIDHAVKQPTKMSLRSDLPGRYLRGLKRATRSLEARERKEADVVLGVAAESGRHADLRHIGQAIDQEVSAPMM